MPTKQRNPGGEIEAGGDATSATDTTAATMWYTALFANFGAKGSGGATIGVKLWTLVAGVRTLVVTLSSTLAQFAGKIRIDDGGSDATPAIQYQASGTGLSFPSSSEMRGSIAGTAKTALTATVWSMEGYVSARQAAAAATTCFEAWNKAVAGDNLFENFFTEGGSGTLRGSIDYNRAGGLVRYNTSSDRTLKKDIVDAPAEKSLEILRSTKLREFTWKDDQSKKRQIGVIAQELVETFKGAVSVGGMVKQPDLVEHDNEGKEISRTPQPDVYQPWGVDKTAFVFHMIAGWQAHDERIAELERKIKQLTKSR